MAMYQHRTNAILAVIAFATSAFADFDLSWRTIDSGGGFSAGGVFEFEVTVGQPDPGAMSGGNFELVGGFWAVPAEITPPPCPGDIDGDNDVDIGDLSMLLSQFGSTGSGLSGDLDHDGDVDIADLSTLLSNFGVVCR